MQRYERDLKRIGAARSAQTVGAPVGCLYEGLDEAAAKRSIGPHERLVLSTLRSVGARQGSRLLEVIPACRRRANAVGKSGGRGTFRGARGATRTAPSSPRTGSARFTKTRACPRLRGDRELPHRRALEPYLVRPEVPLGLPDVKNYDGSWTGWGNLVRAPIERAAA